MGTKEKIISIVLEEGPMLPVEISSKVGLDSFLIKGFLEELIKEGKIKVYEQKVGTDFIYYIPGQEQKLSKKYQESKDAVVRIKTYSDKQIRESPELRQKREEFIQRLRKIEEREKIEVPEEPKKIESKRRLFPLREKSEEVVPKVEVKSEASFLELAERFLDENRIRIIEKRDERKKSKELIASVPSKLYPIIHLIIIKDKKKINKSDMALAYAKSLELKMPVLVITHGDLTKGAEEYLQEVGEFLKIKSIK
ncbi:MAG: hypothetical protein JSW73_04590 [Candidatus Woesearchaeota archaeon]|nr:MAG: hypothetical protein JSW73_04590 [Candidatus Woesearchaeota archaeon]